jgi:hypothetical protein
MFLVRLPPEATNPNCMSVVLIVKQGGGGTGELSSWISSNVQLAPSSLDE